MLVRARGVGYLGSFLVLGGSRRHASLQLEEMAMFLSLDLKPH